MTDQLRGRFAATAGRIAESEERRRGDLSERVRRFVQPRGDERVLDAGAGTGALAFALAPLVREVVAVDAVPELLAEGRKHSDEFPNVTFVEADLTQLPAGLGGFDLVGTLRTLHHIRRPELAFAELTRATRRGGRLLIVDQVAPADPLVALELDRFERARDPTHQRTLSDADFRHFFEANYLRLQRHEVIRETRDLEPYLDLAGCSGEGRDQARALAPAPETFAISIAWYLLVKPSAAGL